MAKGKIIACKGQFATLRDKDLRVWLDGKKYTGFIDLSFQDKFRFGQRSTDENSFYIFIDHPHKYCGWYEAQSIDFDFIKADNIDLFEDYENIPEPVANILNKYPLEDGNYSDLANCLKELEAIGYTYEYYLDGTPYNLRKIND